MGSFTYKLTSGTTVYPLFYTEDGVLVYKQTIAELTEEVTLHNPFCELPTSLKMNFPMIFEYYMHLFHDPIKDENLYLMVAGFAYCQNNVFQQISVRA